MSQTINDILKAYSDIDDTELGEDKFMGHHDAKEAAQQILDLCLECVGEDFVNWGELETEEQHDKRIENELRAEIRQRLKEALGGK